jgi:glucose dehydrogenase
MKLLFKSVAMAAALGAASLASAQSWPVYGGDDGNQRYSKAAQITPANVNKLSVKWALQLGTNRSQESTPILVGDTLYVTSSFGPKNVFAVNAKTGDVRWKYSPEMPKGVDQYACCDVNSRGVSYNDGKIFFGRLDAQVTALDAKTGKEMWTTKIVDYRQGSDITSPPPLV